MLSVTLAFLFGFAAQRGSLCAVSAINAFTEDKTFGPFLSGAVAEVVEIEEA
jgi:hypothetical protein